MDTNVRDHVEKLKGVCEAATPGDWYKSSDGESVWARLRGFGDVRIANGMEDNDSDFLIAAAQWLPRLLEHIDMCNKRIAELEGERKAALEDMKLGECRSCKYLATKIEDEPCRDCIQNEGHVHHEWRGKSGNEE